MKLSSLLDTARSVFDNFGPLVVFYAVNRFYGLPAAIAASMFYSAGEVLWKLRRKEKISSFFKFSVGITLLFGAVDLALPGPFLFKYEATITNGITGIYFGLTLFGERPLIQEFAEKRKNRGPLTASGVYVCRALTGVWTVYFFAKAGLYAWLASRHSVEEALVLRAAIGTASFYGLLFVSLFLAGPFFRLLWRAGLLSPIAQ